MATIPSGIRGISAERRDPRLGKIRLGRRAPNQNPCRQHQVVTADCQYCTHPVMSPYFVFDDDTPGRALQEMFGEECAALPIALPADEASEFARRHLEMWGAGTLKCRGNGEIAEALVVVAEYERYQAEASKTGKTLAPPVSVWASTSRAGNGRKDAEPERRLIPCFGMGYDGQPACPKYAGGDCKPTMHLNVIVRGFPGLGIFQVDTGSVVNIQRIDDFLAYLGRFTGDRYAMVPLWMRLEPYQMRGRTFYGLQLDVDFAAMATGAAGLPGVGQLSIPERVTKFLPEETQRPAAMVVDGTVEDEPPTDVIDGEPEDDDAPADVPPFDDAPTGPGGDEPPPPPDDAAPAQRAGGAQLHPVTMTERCPHDRVVNEARMWKAAEKRGAEVAACGCCSQPCPLGDTLCRFCKATPADQPPAAAEQMSLGGAS